jgi:hypothetical protein
MYNRNWTTARTTDSGANYSYTSATLRQARASAGNQISVLTGLIVDSLIIKYASNHNTPAVVNGFGLIAIGEDSTSTGMGALGYGRTPAAVANTCSPIVNADKIPLLGFHTYAALEAGDGANAATFNVSTNASLVLSVWN